MTSTQHLHGPGAGLFGQIGRWLTLASAAVIGAFMLFFFSAFALILISAIAIIALVAVAIFWVRAKLTGKPFGPRAQMDAHMAELRRQMGADFQGSAHSMSDGPVIDAHETPEGWTVER